MMRIAMLACAALAAAAAQAQVLGFGSAPQGSIGYNMSSAIARVMSESAQVTLERIVDAIISTGGLTRKDVVPVLVPNVVRGADDFIEGKTDGGFFALGAAKVAEVDKSVGGIRYLPLPDDPKSVAAMKKIMPYAYIKLVNPSPAFVGVDGPTNLMAYDYLVAVGAHIKDDTVYRIVKAMYENKAKLAESLRAFGGWDPATINKEMPASFHPGSLRFFKEKGIGAG